MSWYETMLAFYLARIEHYGKLAREAAQTDPHFSIYAELKAEQNKSKVLRLMRYANIGESVSQDSGILQLSLF